MRGLVELICIKFDSIKFTSALNKHENTNGDWSFIAVTTLVISIAIGITRMGRFVAALNESGFASCFNTPTIPVSTAGCQIYHPSLEFDVDSGCVGPRKNPESCLSVRYVSNQHVLTKECDTCTVAVAWCTAVPHQRFKCGLNLIPEYTKCPMPWMLTFRIWNSSALRIVIAHRDPPLIFLMLSTVFVVLETLIPIWKIKLFCLFRILYPILASDLGCT
jgi:hypothetical protein